MNVGQIKAFMGDQKVDRADQNINAPERNVEKAVTARRIAASG